MVDMNPKTRENALYQGKRIQSKPPGENRMEITVSDEQGRVPVKVFHIQGDIDAESFEQLETQAQQAIKDGSQYLVLDLAQVSYISSYGIRGISQIFSWLRANAEGEDSATLSKGLRDGTFKSHHLKLANPSRQVEKVLSTAGMDMFLEIHNDLKRAVDSF
jgi:anti-anti-sigma factor